MSVNGATLLVNSDNESKLPQSDAAELILVKKKQTRMVASANTVCFFALVVNVSVIFLITKEEVLSPWSLSSEGLVWVLLLFICGMMCCLAKCKSVFGTLLGLGILLVLQMALFIVYAIGNASPKWTYVTYCILAATRLLLIVTLIFQTHHISLVVQRRLFLEHRIQLKERQNVQPLPPEETEVIVPQKLSNTEDLVLAYTYDTRSRGNTSHLLRDSDIKALE